MVIKWFTIYVKTPSSPTEEWDICVLYQKHCGIFINPSATGYASLSKNVSFFHEFIHLSCLNDGNGMKKTHIKLSDTNQATFCVMQQKYNAIQDKTAPNQSPLKQHLHGVST